jgi:RNA polymerase sigma-70 factor (ECF subfamily)
MSSHDSRRRLADWFRRWRAPLRKFLIGRAAVPASDLDDVAQEVFLRLLRYERTELIEHPQAYLYKMAANVAAEWSIRVRNSRPHESKWLAGLPADDSPDREVGATELQNEVERALSRLSPRQCEVLKLQYFEGLSRAEIAARIGGSERVVKRAIVTSYERLRQELDPVLLERGSDGRD